MSSAPPPYAGQSVSAALRNVTAAATVANRVFTGISNTIYQMSLHRCAWSESDPLMRAYHDQEWGVPEYDSRALWEKLMLDGFQAGLSWSIILRKRDAFRKAFQNFDPSIVARFKEADVVRLLADAGIVRSRAKIEATIGGARAYLAMQAAGE